MFPRIKQNIAWRPPKPRGDEQLSPQSTPAPLCKRLRQKEKLWQLLCQLAWPLPATLPGHSNSWARARLLPHLLPTSSTSARNLLLAWCDLLSNADDFEMYLGRRKATILVFPCHGQKAHTFSYVRVTSVGIMYCNDGLYNFFYFDILA